MFPMLALALGAAGLAGPPSTTALSTSGGVGIALGRPAATVGLRAHSGLAMVDGAADLNLLGVVSEFDTPVHLQGGVSLAIRGDLGQARLGPSGAVSAIAGPHLQHCALMIGCRFINDVDTDFIDVAWRPTAGPRWTTRTQTTARGMDLQLHFGPLWIYDQGIRALPEIDLVVQTGGDWQLEVELDRWQQTIGLGRPLGGAR